MEYIIEETVLGILLSFIANDKCFSPRSVDRGTLAMLSRCEISRGQKILDLGCGYGAVGIWCAHFTEPENVFMNDIDAGAVSLANENAARNNVPGVNAIVSDGFDAINETGFVIILCNPPYHSDFAVAKRFVEKGFNRLKVGGCFFMVVKRLEWYKNKFIKIFGGVEVYRDGEYFVLRGERRREEYGKRQ